MLPIQIQGAPNRLKQGGRGVSHKGESSRRAARQGFRCAVRDGVGKPSGRANDGYGAVFQAIKLIQAGRLVKAWHKKDVCAGLNLMRQRFIEPERQSHALAESYPQFPKEVMVDGIAFA